jgi:hypothetical protein
VTMALHTCTCAICRNAGALCSYERALVDLLEERAELQAVLRALRAQLDPKTSSTGEG